MSSYSVEFDKNFKSIPLIVGKRKCLNPSILRYSEKDKMKCSEKKNNIKNNIETDFLKN